MSILGPHDFSQLQPHAPSTRSGLARIVLLGGSGFLGAPLARRLLDLGYAVRVVDDRTEFSDGALPRSERLDFVSEGRFFARPEPFLNGVAALVHLRWRGISRAVPLSDRGEMRENVVPSRRLLRAAPILPILFASSAGAIYGELACVGRGAREDSRPDPVRAYGRAKLQVEQMLQSRPYAGGLILRPANPYGPGQTADARCGVVGTFLTRIAAGRPVALYGAGTVERDFVYVDDLAEIFVLGIARAVSGFRSVYNVGGGEATSLAHLLALVERTVGRRARIDRLPPRHGDRRRVLVDVERARAELGWRPRIGLEEGLERTWFALRGAQRAFLGPVAAEPRQPKLYTEPEFLGGSPLAAGS